MQELVRGEKKRESYRQKAKELVAQMTLSEKCSQLLFNSPAIPRLSIKAYNWWNEALHGVARAGVATVFPQAITMACSFDEDMLEEVADAISTEARAKYNMQQRFGDTGIYKGLTFWSPNVNIFRDPRWGRGHETYGEDPYLTSRLGVRFVEGLQGHDANHMKAAACAKHFAVHSGPEDLRHSFNAEVSLQDLYETYLPAFEACVKEAKVEAVMGAYNRTNGEPCCGSKTLLHDILREKWGFEGHVTSDCWAIKDFYEGHEVVDGPVEAVALAINNGCDVNCGNLFAYAEQAVEEGLLSEEKIDQALIRLFTTRYKLGIMEDSEKTVFDEIPYLAVDDRQMQERNRKTALKCMVLLKNDGLLPLKKEKLHTVGVIGPNANNRRALVGNYEGTSSRYITVLEGIQDYLGDDVRVLYSEGCHLYRAKTDNLAQDNNLAAEVQGVCEESDVIICCLGLDAGLEGEEGDAGNAYASGDKKTLELPGYQNEVLRMAVESGKPVILVLLAGSAMAIGYAKEHASAILYGGYPGAQGGAAIAQTLFGDHSPEGKLPITFYHTTEELPDFTDYSMQGRTYRYMKNEALYPFGYGLSYTKFELGDAKLTVREDGTVDVSVSIQNVGSREGAEVLQAYVKVEKDETPNPQLKAFRKVHLLPGEKKDVTLTLNQNAFTLVNQQGERVDERKHCVIYVGTSQPDACSAVLTGQHPQKLVL